MEFQIEIIEGHDTSSYFWFRPVILKEKGKILYDEVIELEEEISIEEGDVECFLSYFLYKYFDKNLTYNKRRYEQGMGYISDFEWYLTYNFYTYDTLTEMIKEIDEVADLLESDYNNPRLDNIKKNFSIFYMCAQNDTDYINRDNTAIQKHISVVIDFYHRFTKRIAAMMENNKNTTVISIMGP
ncbi:MAG: hypothetical protein NC433_07475 [Clostridiales bacterium]|nr:hypothetical protein [Clostridiales bacterium]